MVTTFPTQLKQTQILQVVKNKVLALNNFNTNTSNLMIMNQMAIVRNNNNNTPILNKIKCHTSNSSNFSPQYLLKSTKIPRVILLMEQVLNNKTRDKTIIIIIIMVMQILNIYNQTMVKELSQIQVHINIQLMEVQIDLRSFRLSLA